MSAIVHLRIPCPRCGGYGVRELNRLPEEGHGVFMCVFCKHTWCEVGRTATGDVPAGRAGQPLGEAS